MLRLGRALAMPRILLPPLTESCPVEPARRRSPGAVVQVQPAQSRSHGDRITICCRQRIHFRSKFVGLKFVRPILSGTEICPDQLSPASPAVLHWGCNGSLKDATRPPIDALVFRPGRPDSSTLG